ncbi:MAG: hypothetical protein L3J82_09365 [Planctomycetes bacterium]|nr:hypothetical protein [Planctomycetota bacterium]
MNSLDGVVSVETSVEEKSVVVQVKMGTKFDTKIADDAIGKDFPISNVEVLAVD